MLEARLLVFGRSARERRESLVDLQRIGRDGDRVLAARAQQLGDRDGQSRLADGVGAEDR
jgi:hypothetical protein